MMAVVAQTIAQLKEMICRKKTPNVCFYYEPTGGIYRSKRTVCGLKDKCPPIHHKLNDVIKNDGLVRMETSRGCPWNKCSFCIMPWKFCGEKWRAFSNEKIEIEIKYLIDNGAREVLFTDEDFVCNYEHPFASIPIAILIFVCAYFVDVVIKKIPLIGKWIV